MRNVRFWIIVGLVVGAVWAVTGWDGALLTIGLGAVGALVGFVIEQGVDLRQLLRQDSDV